MKIILKPENETIQINTSEPFNEYESSVNACPRIGEHLVIEGKGTYIIEDVRHDISIYGADSYALGETVIIAVEDEG
jgi:hypothetical protein